MRTLVVSDMHLGSRLGRDVLRRAAALEPLLAAIEEADRLVLLGDVVELLEGRPRQAMAAAEPVLRQVGRAAAGREIVLVPGNHDVALVRAWARRAELTVDTLVPPDATPLLAQLTAWLGRVEVRYPGVFLAPRVWATHGHYLDRHLVPESAYGIARGLLRRRARERVTPADYDRPGPTATRLEAMLTSRLPSLAARWMESAAEAARAGTMPTAAPLTARVLGFQMRRAAIPALATVVRRLGVEADWVIFGHVHRCGPLPGDDPSRWGRPPGPRIVNTGSWVYEPRLVHRATPPHPYWPGGAVILDDDGPRAVGLLDAVPAELLSRAR